MAFADCPDVLGAVTRSRAIINGNLQCAVGVYPAQSALGLPFQALVLLQNATDRPLDIIVRLLLPSKDKAGNQLSFFTPRQQHELTLAAVEVGVLYLPIVAQPPTPINQNYPLIIELHSRAPFDATIERPPKGGRPTNILSVSPFKLNVLREVNFSATERQPGQLVTQFSLIPGHIPSGLEEAQPKYEALWTIQELREEIQAAENLRPEARKFAQSLTRNALADPLHHLVQEKFASVQLPLHPGEVQMIAKLMNYTLRDGLDQEPGFRMESSRWFRRLCRLLASDAKLVNNLPVLLDYLFSAALRDAVLLGLHLCTSHLHIDLGGDEERQNYGAAVEQAINGQKEMSLSYLYLPLVMGGIILNEQVRLPNEDLRNNLVQVNEALSGRVSLAGTNEVFTVSRQLLDSAQKHF
jgi:hypothetical protein